MIRPAIRDDLPFIVDSWVGSFADHPTVRDMGRKVYRQTWSKLIARLIQSNPVLVMCDDETPSIIKGWMAYEGKLQGHEDILHYIFVRDDLRHAGIAHELLKAAPSFRYVTARTRHTDYIYMPSLLWRHLAEIPFSG